MTANEENRNRINVQLIQSDHEWKKLESVWETLWETTPNASVFSSFHLIYSWYKHAKKRLVKPYILLLSDENGDPVGLAPLFRLHHVQYGIPIRTITFIPDPILRDRPIFLIPTMVKRQLKKIFEYLYDHRKKWDQLLFPEQLINDTYTHVFNSIFGDREKFWSDIITSSVAPYISFDHKIDSWDTYLGMRSKGHRKKWRNFMNRFNKTGHLEIIRYTDYKDFSLGLKEYKDLELRSSKSKKIFMHKSHIKIYKDLITSKESAGRIHIVFLRLNGRPIAGIIGYEYKKKYAAIHTAYDKEFASNSPGFMVGGFDIKWAIENDMSEYDFMGTCLTDKLRWTDSFHKTLRSRVIHKNRFGYLYALVKLRINPSIKYYINSNNFLTKLLNFIIKPQTKINESKFDSHNMMINTDS